jgi:hypothetical protein
MKLNNGAGSISHNKMRRLLNGDLEKEKEQTVDKDTETARRGSYYISNPDLKINQNVGKNTVQENFTDSENPKKIVDNFAATIGTTDEFKAGFEILNNSKIVCPEIKINSEKKYIKIKYQGKVAKQIKLEKSNEFNELSEYIEINQISRQDPRLKYFNITRVTSKKI